jgi:hypothetical protein
MENGMGMFSHQVLLAVQGWEPSSGSRLVIAALLGLAVLLVLGLCLEQYSKYQVGLNVLL